MLPMKKLGFILTFLVSIQCWTEGKNCHKNCGLNESLEDGTCVCNLGYRRSDSGQCDETPCTDQPCLNNGTCEVAAANYTCNCNTEFTGTNCEISRCESGWFLQFDKCYYLSENSSTWFEAETNCAGLGGFLTEPKSSDEISFLKDKAISENDTFWLGGTDKAIEGTWVWDNSSTLIVEHDWSIHVDPFAGDMYENCLIIDETLSFAWNEYGCYRNNRFICEKDAITN